MARQIKWDVLRAPRPRTSLHHEVASHIGALIGEGRLAPGAILPNEAMLGDKFGVSRTVLREAMKVLASKRLVEVRRRTGTRVRQRAEWNMFDPDVLSWSFSGADVPAELADLLEVRLVIEPAAARMAAERAETADLVRIEEAYRSMEANLDDPTCSIEPDLQFHFGILAASHNAFMSSFGTLIQMALRASLRFTNRSASKRVYSRSLVLHKRVLAAIQSRNPRKAESEMAGLLVQTSQDIEKGFGRVRHRRV